MQSPKTKGQDSLLVDKMWAFATKLRNHIGDDPLQSPSNKCKLVGEIPHLPTVVLDLDGTLIHTLVDPTEIAAAQQNDLRTIQLPGKMGVVFERPGLEQLFASLHGYNVVLYSAGGSCYVHTVIEKLLEKNPFMQSKICKILCRPALVRYSMSSEVPSDTPLTDGVYYVKDLCKARRDGNRQKVLIVDDNPHAFQVHPDMEDADFKTRYDFSMNALPVVDFIATDPKAVFDTDFARVGRVLEEIATTLSMCRTLGTLDLKADAEACVHSLTSRRASVVCI
jgi:hypothetical protein